MINVDRYSHEAIELQLYLENDNAAWHAYYLPVCRTLARKHNRGEFNRDLGIKAMRRCVDNAAKQYNLEHGSMTTAWHDLFPKGDRDRVAEHLVDRFLDALRAGCPFW